MAGVHSHLEDVGKGCKVGLGAWLTVPKETLSYERSWTGRGAPGEWGVSWAEMDFAEFVRGEGHRLTVDFREPAAIQLYPHVLFDLVTECPRQVRLLPEKIEWLQSGAGVSATPYIVTWIGEQATLPGSSRDSEIRGVKLPESIDKRFKQLEGLKEDWDSYGARGIARMAIEKAKFILLRITARFGTELVQEVFVAPCTDGGLQLELNLESEMELLVRIPPFGNPCKLLLEGGSEEEPRIEKDIVIEGEEDMGMLFRELNNWGGPK